MAQLINKIRNTAKYGFEVDFLNDVSCKTTVMVKVHT
jgi:hypothetical protein